MGSRDKTTRGISAARCLRSTGLAALALVACGGGSDFKNEPRPPVAIELTGVITQDRVTISPKKLGAGPVILTISNQTRDAHTIVLEGDEVEETVGPIEPLQTGTIQRTLEPGVYSVEANSDGDETGIDPGVVEIGDARPSGEDQLLLP